MQQARQLAPDCIPNDPRILGPINCALTERIKRLLSPEDYVLWRLLDEATAQGTDDLTTVIWVKLDRIKRENADEYNHCQTQIAKIAKCEALAPLATEMAEAVYLEINASVSAICSAQADTHQHVAANVSDQSRILRDYLITERYPVDAQSDGTRKEWLKAHWTRMVELLTAFPCRCSYSTSYDEFVGPWLQANQRGGTKLRLHSDTTHLILGFLHNASPESVRRKLIIS